MRRSDFDGPGDLRAMQELASRLWTPRTRFHPGQLAWSRYYAPTDPRRPRDGEAISLWWAQDRLVGFAWADGPDWVEVQVDPAHPGVHEEAVEWFEEWSDAPTQHVQLMEDDDGSAWAAAGFAPAPDAWFFTHHLLDLASDEVRSSLAARRDRATGYTLRHLTGPDEIEERARCHRRAWSDNGPSRVTGEAYAALTTAWPYRHDLDWVAVDATGGMVASSLVWLDPRTGVGLVEPVGCAPEHRGRGLAPAVIAAALLHLAEVGGRTALITPRGDDDYPGPRRLYRSMGFAPASRTVTWTRSLEGPEDT